jgi:hypothetical protein
MEGLERMAAMVWPAVARLASAEVEERAVMRAQVVMEAMVVKEVTVAMAETSQCRYHPTELHQ